MIPTSLEREMEEVHKLHQEAEKRRKLNKRHLEKILMPKTGLTKRSTKPLTEPEEFTFVTASRLGYKMPKAPSAKKVHLDCYSLVYMSIKNCRSLNYFHYSSFSANRRHP